jgi:hypothetical protein
VQTQRNESRIEFHGLGERVLTTDFEGGYGYIVSDGGVPLIAEVDQMFGVLQQYAKCFTDHRDQEVIEHSVLTRVSGPIRSLLNLAWIAPFAHKALQETEQWFLTHFPVPHSLPSVLRRILHTRAKRSADSPRNIAKHQRFTLPTECRDVGVAASRIHHSEEMAAGSCPT